MTSTLKSCGTASRTARYLSVVLLPNRRHVIHVLLVERQMTGQDVVFAVLRRPGCVISVNLSDPSGNHHLHTESHSKDADQW